LTFPNAPRGAAVAGGGIAGLVAGAALAARGIPVSVFERNARPGGSCASFRRGPWRFDTGISTITGLGPGGRLRRIFDEIGLDLPFDRPAVRETVVASRFSFSLPSDPGRAREALDAAFPASREAIARLLSLPREGGALRPGTTFAEVLSGCGVTGEPAFLFEALLGNLGVPAGRADGATALSFLHEFLFDGGYYPAGGTEALSGGLAARIRAGGGRLRCGAEVVAFRGAGGRIGSLSLADGTEAGAEFFVSALSARRTAAMAPSGADAGRRPPGAGRLPLSPSAFLLFLGLDCRLDALTPHRGHVLSLPEGAASDLYLTLSDDRRLFSPEGYVYLISPSRTAGGFAPPGGESVCLFALAPYRGRAFWESNRERMADALLARAERVAPGISRRVAFRESATPLTLERYTGNDEGAIYGWESAPGRGGASRPSPATGWDNLVLAGHWTRPGSGISAAATSGWLAARMAARSLGEGSRPTGPDGRPARG
jgi:phytoene dehydrogenase-like protein